MCAAATAVENGAFDADLGGGVYKQRIARSSSGKSGGFRTILCFKEGSHTFFVYGFAKSARASIRADELHGFRKLADMVFAYGSKELRTAVESGALIEVFCDGDQDESEGNRQPPD